MDTIGQTITIILSILAPMAAFFGWCVHRFDKKFDKIDGRFQQIDTRLNSIDTRLNSIDNRLHHLEGRIEGRVEERVFQEGKRAKGE